MLQTLHLWGFRRLWGVLAQCPALWPSSRPSWLASPPYNLRRLATCADTSSSLVLNDSGDCEATVLQSISHHRYTAMSQSPPLSNFPITGLGCFSLINFHERDCFSFLLSVMIILSALVLSIFGRRQRRIFPLTPSTRHHGNQQANNAQPSPGYSVYSPPPFPLVCWPLAGSCTRV